MPRPRRFQLFPSDAEVVSVAAEFTAPVSHARHGARVFGRYKRRQA